MPSVARHLRKLCILGLLASPAHAADDWQAVTFISETVGNHSNRLCMGVPDHMRGSDIGCPTYAPSLTTGGHVSITGNVSANRFIGDGSGLTNLNVQGDRIVSGTHAAVANEQSGIISLTTGGSTWGYFSSGWSRLANLFADTVSSTLVSATHVSASYVDTTRGGTVSGTYGYFQHISGTYLSGDGSGLYNVPASAVSGLNLDRITSGSHALIANQGTGYVSLTTGGSTWGYLSAGWSRLANLFADTVSSTLVSATHVSATYVDTTRGGTVSGTYGYFHHISGTDVHGRFSGDGSGLTGVTAAASDRIVSGSTGGTRMVAISNTGFISITQAGANSGWFDPTRGLVTLGVSATGAISGTRGYFRDSVGIGTLAPVGALHIAGLSHSRSVRLSSDLGAYTELGILNNTASWFDINPHPLTASENSTIRFFRNVSTTGVAEVIFHRADGGGDPVAVIGNTRIALGMNGINVGIGLWSTGARLGVAGTISATDAIQVGSSSLTCGAGIAGALRYSGSKIEYCNGTAWGALIGAADAMGDRIVSGSTNIIAHQDRSLTFTTNNQQRMVIGEDGNVGIGSSVPQGRLHISTPNSTPALFLSRDGDANVSIAFASSLGDSLIDGGGSGGHLRFYTAGQQRMLLNSEGNIVIGSAYAGSSLTIAGEAQVGNSGGACNSAQNAGAIRYTAGNLLFCNNANTWIALGAAGATTAASNTGAVQFNSNNQLAGDTNNFFWDNANKRLGIGISAPPVALTVSSSGYEAIRIVGHGATGGASAGYMSFYDSNGLTRYGFIGDASSNADDTSLYLRADVGNLHLGDSSGVQVVTLRGGHVGVGTATPTATLHVSGSFIVSTSAQTTTPSLFVASNGSVGFGTSNPLVPFHIAKPQVGGNAIAYIGDFVNGFENNNNGIGFTIFSNGSNYIDLKTFAGGSTYFRTGSGVESGAARVAMEIAGDTGNVGFGKAAVARVDVSGTISATNAIQVGTSTLTCGAGLAGAIRYETTSNTLQICTGATGWRSLVSGTAGSGATSLAALTDVNLTSLAGRDYLRYDHATSRWVNISESTVMSTTTMVPGWPDAIRCTYSGTSYRTLYLQNAPHTDGTYWYTELMADAQINSNYHSIVFTSAGTFQEGYGMYANPANHDCNDSISGIYSRGKAFNFIGNNGLNSGNALGDRITSGTHAVTVNTTSGVVSLSTAGTTWGYLNSTRSYLPALSSVQVSSTNVSATLLQVGTGNGAACDASRRGSMRYSTISSTMEYCNSSAWVSMGPSATAVPSVHAYLSADQNHAASSYVKIAFNAKRYDTNNNFDTANGRFTPTIPGKYLVTLTTLCNVNSNSHCYAAIYKNGSVYQTMFGAGTSYSYGGSTLTTIVDMNGTTDYLEGYINQSGTQLFSGSSNTTFHAALITMNGNSVGGGGGGSSDLAGLTDVTLTSLAGRDYLRYDADTSRWVNVPESTVMSTTTMVSGWPDAIRCDNGAGTYYTLMLDNNTSSIYYYHMAQSSGASAAYLAFNGNGTYNSNAALAGTDCVTGSKSIQQLYAEGKAFNFIGNSATGGGAALGDRITSGTHAVTVNSASGVVSLSTAGTTWGYLNSTRSYLPALTSTQVSSTNVSATLLQVGTGNGAACDASRRGAMRYSTVSSTMEYCNSNAWVSMGPSATVVPAFSVAASSAAIATGAVKLNMTVKSFDTNNNFDLALDRFTPTLPGYYLMTGKVNICGGVVDGAGYHALVYKNGVSQGLSGNTQSGIAVCANPAVTQLVYANGTTDYFELYVQSTAGSALTAGGQFQGVLISMGGAVGGGGGGGADNLGDHTATQNLAMGAHNIIGTGQVSMTFVSASNVSATHLQLSSPTTVLACNSGLAGAMRYTSGTMQVCNGTSWGNIGIGVPAGTISAFAAASCPSGWVEYGPARGRFLRGIDNGAGNDPDGTRTPGNVQADMIAAHTHGLPGSLLHNSAPADFSSQAGGSADYRRNVNAGDTTTSTGGIETRPKNVAVIFCSYAGFQSEVVPGISTLGGLSDVSIGGASTGQVLAFDGANWVASNTTTTGSALGDRITSGTHAVTVNTASGLVSLSTGGTTWGYLSSGNSFLPTTLANRVSATNVSASNVSATHLQLSSPTTVLACNSGLAGAMRYTSGTMQVCNGTSWGNIGIGVPAGTISAFAAASCPSGWVEYGPARGRFLRGIDNGAGNDPSGTRAPGNVQADALQEHGHTVNYAASAYDGSSYASPFRFLGARTSDGSLGTSAIAIPVSGANKANETRPKNVAVIFCSYAGYESELAPGITTLGGLSDVSVGGASTGQVLAFDGANWVASNTTAASNALGDRITSGTHAVTVNTSSGYVSLSTAGTTWGYLSSGNSYLPLLSSGRVSSTNVSATLLQVGTGNGAACDASRRGSMRYSTISSTMEYCNSSAWVSMGPSATVPVSFRVNKGGANQTGVTPVVNTKMTWPIEVLDTNNNFAGDRFTATIPGLYLIMVDVYCEDSTTGCMALIYRNGTNYFQSGNRDASGLAKASAIVSLGVGDYVEAYGRTDGGTLFSGITTLTQFSGVLLGPQSSGAGGGGSDNLGNHTATQDLDMATYNINNAGTVTGSGGAFGGLTVSGASSLTTISTSLIQAGASAAACDAGLAGGIRYNAVSNTLQVCTGTTGWKSLTSGTAVSSLDALTDVNISSLAGRDYLRYDAGSSRWVNISESTVMSTTTMVPGWPDAILCSSATASRTLYQQYFSPTDGMMLYATPYDGAGGRQYVTFNHNTKNYQNHSGLGGYDCVTGTKSISTLYAEGSAFNFIGNGGTGSGDALGDRITSGTHAVTLNSATGVVSLSTAGTTWGYLTSGNSYLPAVMAGRVSATNISATTIHAAGNVQAFSFLHPSDERLKADITSIPNAAAILESLRGTHFTWKSNGKFSYGLIAQEIETVMPSAVHGTDSKVVDYNQFIAVLVEGWKAHHKAIASLKADNDHLEQRVQNFELTNDGLRRWNLQLREELETVKADNDNLRAEFTALRGEVQQLRQANAP